MTSVRWEARRRDEWLRCRRWRVPAGAKMWDGFTDRAAPFARAGFGRAPYEEAMLTAGRYLAEDRGRVEEFREERPVDAAQVEDVLEYWLTDLSELEQAMRLRRDGVEEVRLLLADTSTFGERLLAPVGRRRR